MFIASVAVLFFCFALLCLFRYWQLKGRRQAFVEEIKKRLDDLKAEDINVFLNNKYPAGDGWEASGVVFIVVSIVFLFLSIVFTMTSYSSQLEDFEKVTEFENVRVIYQAKAEAITSEFKMALIEKYPEYEKGVFDSISPDNINIYLVKYPELRNIDAVLRYVESINSLQSDIYNMDIAIEGIERNIRYRLVDPWIFSFLIPAKK